MPFATRLRLQSAAPDPNEADLSGPPAELRHPARAYLRGVNAPRSLANALLYASVAAARGDRGSTRPAGPHRPHHSEGRGEGLA
ncbi:MAG: hypothetical protein WA873_05145, partial [Jannaschia helgolandensis]